MAYKEALEAAGAEVLEFKTFGSYQGDWWAKVNHKGETFWVHGTYGSCSGCDAYEAEFGYYNEERCDEHRYDREAVGCVECGIFAIRHLEKLAAFGENYLTSGNFTQDEAVKYASANLDWDSDAPKMLKFITDNAL